MTRLGWVLAGLTTTLIAAVACGDMEADAVTVATGDVALFAGEVQPVFGIRCANPSCHGNAERPFQLYAQHRNRLAPGALHSDDPLTDDELTRNLYSAAAMLLDVERAHDAPLLTKPLAPVAGGSDHGGGTQFYDVDDAEYRAVLAWARTVVQQAQETEP